jgi:predicted PurR-regulated permease PerM
MAEEPEESTAGAPAPEPPAPEAEPSTESAEPAADPADAEGRASVLLRSLPSLWGLPRFAVAGVFVAIFAIAFLTGVQATGMIFAVVNQGIGEMLPVLLISLIAAYLLDPLIDRFEARGWDRTRAIFVALVVFLSGTTTLFLLLIPYVVNEVADLSGNLDEYLAGVAEQGATLETWLSERLGREIPLGFDELQKNLPKLLETIPAGSLDPIRAVGNKLVGGSFGILGAIFRWSLFPVFTFFFLRDWDGMKAGLFSLVPHRFRADVSRQASAIDGKLANFVRGQLMVSAALAVMYSLGLVLFTDIHMAVLVGVVAGLLFVVPYFGTFIGVVAGSLLALLEFGVSFEIIKVWAVFGVAQGIEGSLLTPKIVGDSVGLHPVVVMLALLVGSGLFGFLGLLLGVPIAASLQVLIDEAVRRFQASDWFQADA